MTADLLLRTLALCVLLAATETLHGIARTVWVVPRIGKDRALRWSIFSGTLLAYAIGAWRVPDIGLQTPGGRLVLGLVLAVFMASFDLLMGRFVLRRSWSRALSDLDPRTGNRLIYGLVALVVMPLLVQAWRR